MAVVAAGATSDCAAGPAPHCRCTRTGAPSARWCWTGAGPGAERTLAELGAQIHVAPNSWPPGGVLRTCWPRSRAPGTLCSSFIAATPPRCAPRWRPRDRESRSCASAYSAARWRPRHHLPAPLVTRTCGEGDLHRLATRARGGGSSESSLPGAGQGYSSRPDAGSAIVVPSAKRRRFWDRQAATRAADVLVANFARVRLSR
jgi:hypothetical protein